MPRRGICRARPESFGAVLFSENPGFVAFLDQAGARRAGLRSAPGLPGHCLSAPLDVHVSLTTRCNRRCPSCYVRGAGERGEEMTADLARQLLDHFSALGVFTVAFGGGEPFLHPALFELARYARSGGIVPNVTTNGSCVDAERARESRVFGTVHLSLHASDERPELEAAVRYLREAGLRPGLNLLLTEATTHVLEEVFLWAARLEFARILLLREKQPGRADAPWSSTALPPDLWPRAKRAARRHGVPLLLDCSLFPLLARAEEPVGALQRADVGGCRGGDHVLAVDVQGRFKPCSFWPETFGDARTLTRETWAGDEALNRFRIPRTCAPCGSCRYGPLCRGGCRLFQPCQ